MQGRGERLSALLIDRAKPFHITMLILTLLMIPGAMTALEPIDMESYEMESPELSAQSIIEDKFSDSEIILGFMIGVRDPSLVPDIQEWAPVQTTTSGAADYALLPSASEMLEANEPWSGIDAPTGGILNLSVLREIDEKIRIIDTHPLAPAMKPLVNDVTGQQSSGAISLPNHFRSFMNGTSILTQPGLSSLGVPLPAPTNWTDCFPLDCLEFDDENITQQHIDMAASRMADASNNNFLRWLSLDRGFLFDAEGLQQGPVNGHLNNDGEWEKASFLPGRWTASSTWLLVQLDRSTLTSMGWEVVWKDAHQEKSIQFTEDGFQIGGYRLHDYQLILHPPQYNASLCQDMMDKGAGCSTEWSYMDLEGKLRSHDRTTVTLLLGQGVNVEVNRELQSSASLIVLMMLSIVVLLYISLRRWSDVGLVMFALAVALLWMQGLIGYVSSLTSWFGFSIITRSQFSNLLPILVLALGIDDSLHALHRYKEERAAGKSSDEAAKITVHRIGRAITLTSITTMVAFAANLFSDIAALRSFGIEAALGIFSAFLLTGIWTPIIRKTLDDWQERRMSKDGKAIPDHRRHSAWLEAIPVRAGQVKTASIILLIVSIMSIPAVIGMTKLEGDFAVEDFLDEESDFAVGVRELNVRFADEGEPANLLVLGDVLDPRVYAAIDVFRQNMNDLPEGVPDKITRQPDGNIDLLALDEMVFAAQGSLVLDSTPFEAAGWDVNASEHGVGCPNLANSLFVDTSDRDCLAFFYGFLSLYGVPGTGPIPDIPSSIVRLYITPDHPLDPAQPWLDTSGRPASYSMMQIRFGVTQPEDFPGLGEGIEEIWNDLSVFTNLSSGTYEEIGPEEEDQPLTWVMLTGRPITRYAASSAMQEEMQSSLILGSLFVLISLTIGFRSFAQAVVTFLPILVVVVWLYGLMYVLGASLNIVTVTIATISLGVGIDYCIHVTERYRESKKNGLDHDECLKTIGGACGLALFGSATSDIIGFCVIALSPMGLFSSFGIFSAAMIALSLFASLVLTTSLLGIVEVYINQRKGRHGMIDELESTLASQNSTA